MSTDRVVAARQLAVALGGWRHGRPAHRALAEAVRARIDDGRLPLRTRLPAERALAAALGVSRSTVAAAYADLRAAGYLVSRRGSGSRTALPTAARPTGPVPLFAWPAPGGPAAGGQGAPFVDLGVAAPAALPDALSAAVAAAVDALPGHLAGHGYHPMGTPALRAALADRFTVRGLPTRPDEVLVTSGGQAALALLLRLLVRPGDRVLVESPTYPNAIDAVRAAGARPVPTPVTREGWDLPMVRATLHHAGPRVAYLIADFHNPTGHLADDGARAALVAAARRSGTTLVVDETLAELALDPVPATRPVAAHGAPGAVITIGSAGKTYWPGLRLGWVRAPAGVIRELAVLRAAVDLASPVLEQLVVEQLLAQGAAPVRERVAGLRQQRDVLVAALAGRLPEWRFALPAGGLSLWVELPDPVSEQLAAAALRRGVRLVPGPRFGVDGTMERYLRLPYTQPAGVLADAVDRLAAAYAEVRDAPAAGATGAPFAI